MTPGRDHSNRAAGQDVAPDADDGEVGRRLADEIVLAGLDVHQADGVLARTTGDACAGADRDFLAGREADAATEEERRREVRRGADAAGAAAAALLRREREDPLALEEELPLLGEEQAEPRQVHLLLVVFDLGEIGVVGEVEREPPGQPVLDVEAGVAAKVVRERTGGGKVRRERRNRVRLDLQVARLRRRIESDQRRGGGELVHPAHAVRRGHRTEERLLVLPPDRAAQVDTPGLRPGLLVAEGAEWDHHFDGPAVGRAACARVPHRVPVVVVLALARHFLVANGAERVGLEEPAAAAVVEGVEADRQVLIVEDGLAVAPHLAHHHPLGMRVETARRDVQVVLVEHHPRFGALGRGLALVRLLLDELGGRNVVTVHRLVERTIELDRFTEPDRTDRDRALRILRVDGGDFLSL